MDGKSTYKSTRVYRYVTSSITTVMLVSTKQLPFSLGFSFSLNELKGVDFSLALFWDWVLED